MKRQKKDGRSPAGRALRYGALALVGILAYTGWLYHDVRGAATSQPSHPADVIIVLGSGGNASRPSRVYQARLDYAFNLYRRGFAQHVIVTEKAPIAQSAGRYLTGKGTPSQAVFLEDRSKNTWENLKYAQVIMREQGWESAIVVSCGFHLFRALRMCRDLGMNAQGAAATNSPVERSAAGRFKWTLLECPKYFAHRWLGIR